MICGGNVNRKYPEKSDLVSPSAALTATSSIGDSLLVSVLCLTIAPWMTTGRCLVRRARTTMNTRISTKPSAAIPPAIVAIFRLLAIEDSPRALVAREKEGLGGAFWRFVIAGKVPT